jgi:hypothetical protein
MKKSPCEMAKLDAVAAEAHGGGEVVMGRCRNDNLLWAWLVIAAAADSQTNNCNCSEPRDSYNEWDEPRNATPPGPKFRMEHLGYVFWGALAVAWFGWLALQPGHASNGALAPATVAATVPTSVAAPEPAPAPVADAAPAPVDPAVAFLDTLPGALAALPPLAADVLPSRTLQIDAMTVVQPASATPMGRPTSRRWWLAFVK